MSDEPETPPPPATPPPPGGYQPRTRLPFEEQPARVGFDGFRAAAYIYIVAGMLAGAAGAFMAFVQHRAWTDPAVIVPFVAAIYFFVRAAMTLRPRT